MFKSSLVIICYPQFTEQSRCLRLDYLWYSVNDAVALGEKRFVVLLMALHLITRNCFSFRFFSSCSEQWRPLVLPDRYIEHGAPVDQYAAAGLTAGHIAATVLNVLGKTREALELMS